MFRSGFNEKKLKVNLKLVVNRLKLIGKKKTELAIKDRKEIAEYIKLNKLDRARIRVEHIIREDYLVEAMEIVEMYADILMTRLGLVTMSKSLDESLKKPVSSLIWVALRLKTDCQELQVVHDQLAAHYGKEYARACHTNEIQTVCERLQQKLDPHPPPKKLVEQYLIEIARAANLDFTPDPKAMQEDIEAAVPAGLSEEELISFYDKNMPPGGPPGGPPPGNFGGGGGGGNFYYPPGGEASAPPPTASYPLHPQMTLPPYSATDPNSPNSSVGANYAAAADNQPPPLPMNGPAGSPGKADFPSSPSEKKDLSNMHMVSADDYLKPEVPNNPPVAAPRSLSPGLPDLPSVPSSFANDVSKNDSKDEDVDFDDLTKRFENLKKKK